MTLVSREGWRPQGIDNLEPRAWEALRESGESVLVTAGAGAGKTEFLAQKAAFLLQTGICPAPRRILAISFKRDAARNLSDRVTSRCTTGQACRFDSLTFDAFTKSMLDRFRKAIPDPWMPPRDYQLIMPKRQDFEDFLNRHRLYGINTQQLEKAIALKELPLAEDQNVSTRAVSEFWQENFHDLGEVRLSFSMINRLVHWMLRENNQIKIALQKTYPFVFLDEFQDTTHAQFDLLNTAFHGGPAKFTAVGDDKQRIMGWAGAMPDAFEQFEQVYSARRISLLSNWRSHEDLVAIQHIIAQRLDPLVELPVARGVRRVDGDISAIWDFPDSRTERQILAGWIAAEVRSGSVEPHKIGLLVRIYANSVEDDLTPAFAAEGLRLRNLARDIEGISIQDLLDEELTGLLLPLLRLGAVHKNPLDWDKSQRNLNFMYRIDSADHASRDRKQRKLQDFVRTLKRQMREQPLTVDTAREMAIAVRDFWGVDLIRQVFPAYRREQDFDRAWNGFVALLIECSGMAANWSGVLDEFEGIGQVPLMTIHKSKGLEFHTMIFYGLDNRTWWSLQPNNREDLNVFFVALTRAEQRAFFTLCRERGEAINWLEQLLVPAGVRHIDGTTLL
ncbi:UvrD-helicase domain-containing protein [Sneathiella sp. P13V-1]|uniref:UvrD-helicase domain-containing protein n=1 Tax=Sneathiella sp. P13V-1 TaxID=2697366 RepID=UPI00187B7C7A|nr:ATP-dependent helicase [Sneathiella sp. P13V-1]MBE7638238.1 UvrD-helicase domain-containing protein [Sneathiella sp. P13V-1]